VSFAIDANLLLYASDETSPLHERAVELLDQIAIGPEIAYLFWPVTMAYLRIATHPAVFARPLSHADARANVEGLLALPHVQAVGEGEDFWHRFTEVADDVAPTGNLVPDAHLVALMLANGVRTVWTRDRDFRKFTGIRVRDPFGTSSGRGRPGQPT
jgi:toxin-antitoxin system PIN domain toxin